MRFSIFQFHIQLDGSGASAATVGGTGVPSVMGSLSGTKVQSKNGNIFSDGMKDSVIIAATKQLTKKDKRGSNAALQAVSIDTSDTSYLDKASPSLQVKRKSSSIDVTINGPNLDVVQMSSFSNGNPIINEEVKPSPTSANGDYINIDSTDTDLSTTIHGDMAQHNNSKPASTANNNMQISQV